MACWSRTAAFAGALVLSSAVSAAIFELDDRIFLSPRSNGPYAAIGIVSGGSQRATGFLVSDCHVLTVKHLFSDKRRATGKRVRFRSGARRSSRGVVVASGDYVASSGKQRFSEDRRGDWMLVRLDDCPGRQLGHVLLSPRMLGVRLGNGEVADAAQSAGFPFGSLRKGLALDPQCTVRAITEQEWLHDCATLPGNSGSPIFTVAAGGRLHVSAMITGGHHWPRPIPYDDDNSNRATPIGELMPFLRRHIAVGTGSDQRAAAAPEGRQS